MPYSFGVAEPISALNRIRLIENGEPLVDLRTVSPGLQLLRNTSVPWCRKRVAEMFNEARLKLMPVYDIALREAWRSPQRQKFIYDFYYEKMRAQFPDATHARLRRLTNRFFAPYDQKAPPGHSTGAALDVWLLDAFGKVIELNGPGARFRSAPTFSKALPSELREKRMILYEAMASVGFTNCRDEWWHYSYGDAGWAVRAGKPECCYGTIFPPESEYVKQDRKFMRAFLKQPPF